LLVIARLTRNLVEDAVAEVEDLEVEDLVAVTVVAAAGEVEEVC
jgi:hypothetical protein